MNKILSYFDPQITPDVSLEIYKDIVNNAPCPVYITEGLDDQFEGVNGGLLICDDLMGSHSTQIETWFVRRSHHSNCSVIAVTQVTKRLTPLPPELD